MSASINEYMDRFTAFYDSLADVYPEQFQSGAARRIGSTFRVPGAGGLDAQTFYMRHILDLVFQNKPLVKDLVTLARYAFRGEAPPADVVKRVEEARVHNTLYAAAEAGSALTGRIGDWSEGTDLFANILTNTDCALQMAGLSNAAAEKRAHASEASTGATMDQSAIDSLFD